MPIQVPLNIIAGLPYERLFVITFPTGRDWWTTTDDFEFSFQVREEKDFSSALICDLVHHLTDISFTDDDTLEVKLDMSGSDTLVLTESGYYDVIISDIGTDNDRAYPISHGPVNRSAVVSSAGSVGP